MDQLVPEVLALVVADYVHHDDAAEKLFILGTRADIRASTFPWNHPRLSAYVALVEGRGEVSLQIRLVDADEEREPVSEYDTVVTFLDPLTEFDLVFHLNELVFPEPGEYRLQLYANGRFLRERRLVLYRREQPN